MINCLVFFILLFLFFSYILGGLQGVFILAIMSIIIIEYIQGIKQKKSIAKEDLFWLGCCLVNIIGFIRAESRNEAFMFVAIFTTFILLKIVLSNQSKWINLYFIAILLFSSIHTLFTLIQYKLPNIVDKVNKLILSNALYRVNTSQLNQGKYPGITGQVGANAFYISIFIAVIFSICYVEKRGRRKIMYAFLLLLGGVALILTGKRGLLLTNIVIISIFLLVKIVKCLKANNKIWGHMVGIFLIFMAVIFILIISFNINSIINYINAEDLTSGRGIIYEENIYLIKNHILLGCGLGKVKSIFGMEGHNIYIQIWAELGIIGLFLYLSSLGLSLINSVRIYMKFSKMDKTGGKILYIILISIYIQLIFIIYGFTGNPLYDYFELGIYLVSLSVPIAFLKTKYYGLNEKRE